MKKFIAVAAALAMVLALASCGEPTEATSSAAAEPSSTPASSVAEVSSTPIPVISIPEVVSTPDDQNTSANIALAGTAFDCGVATYGEDAGDPHGSNYINDGIRYSGGYQPANWNEGDYCGVKFDTAKIDTIIINWETASYIADYNASGYNVYFLTPGTEDEWVLAADVTAERAPAETGDDQVIDTLSFTAIEVAGVKIEFLDGGLSEVNDGHKYAPKLYELEVYEAAEEAVESETSEAEAE